ncbi:MAG: Aromatic/aminoadipate aminotransferase 1 [Trizodia sp. TS-e1964]|nr:MAG: Aromatic/aminoadipate aminotransferase 1 [Trizodia sp. TS-e1964]
MPQSTNRITIDAVLSWRERSGKLIAGVAASAHSDSFKVPGDGKPVANSSHHRINPEAASRTVPSIKSAAKYLANPGLISLGGGLPTSEYFPIHHLEAKVPLPPNFSEANTRESGQILNVGKYDVADGLGAYALNYGPGTGSPQMLRFVTEHTQIVHNPLYANWGCSLTVGNTSAIDMAYRMFTQRGDCILAEEYTFATAIEAALPMGVSVVGIKMDSEGIIPSVLDHTLTNWRPQDHGGATKPWLLYTVPTGQNPTGATQGKQRKQDIYIIARKHDLYIIEDDPYYFLQMQPCGESRSVLHLERDTSYNVFLDALVPSFLSMDVDGRVLRLDSFSKVIAPGLRVAWITASTEIVNLFIHHSEVSVQTPSGFSQVLLHKLLDESWGHEGYFGWLINLRFEYTMRREVILQACERYLPKEVASWNPPAAGMFVSPVTKYNFKRLKLTMQLALDQDQLEDAPQGILEDYTGN